MKKRTQISNSCGNGKGSCGNKDLFTLPFCGGKRIRGSRRLKLRARYGPIVCLVSTGNTAFKITPAFLEAFNNWKP